MAVAERVFIISPAGEEVVAGAAGGAAGGDWGGDCVYTYVNFGAVFISVPLIDAPYTRHFGVLS